MSPWQTFLQAIDAKLRHWNGATPEPTPGGIRPAQRTVEPSWWFYHVFKGGSSVFQIRILLGTTRWSDLYIYIYISWNHLIMQTLLVFLVLWWWFLCISTVLFSATRALPNLYSLRPLKNPPHETLENSAGKLQHKSSPNISFTFTWRR